MRVATPRGMRRFQQDILAWHRHNGRDYPWRGNRDPYSVLLAEVLLQQTDAPKAAAVYPDFLARFPTVGSLAEASAEEVGDILAPLGLKYRAPRLVCIARHIVANHGGRIPAREKQLLKLPGVGRYIARSVCATAFGQQKGVLDTNVIRVLDRCFGIRSARARAREDTELWDLVNRLVPPRTLMEPAAWNWAVLDFAALVCKYRHPACDLCPVGAQCASLSAVSQHSSSSG